MRPEFALILGCLGLGLVVGYAWWAAVRGTLLRIDLERIRDELDAKMKVRGLTEDLSYRSFRQFIDTMIFMSPYLTLSVIMMADLKPTPIRDEAAQLEGSPPEVVEAKVRLMIRLLLHLVFGSVSSLVMVLAVGGIYNLLTRLLAWSREPRAIGLLSPTSR